VSFVCVCVFVCVCERERESDRERKSVCCVWIAQTLKQLVYIWPTFAEYRAESNELFTSRASPAFKCRAGLDV
jgi:hypothetical protein